MATNEPTTDRLTIDACMALLGPVALALGNPIDRVIMKAYHRALRDVPANLLQVACDRALKTTRDRYEPRFPTAPQLRQWAEDARLAWLKSNPWTACEACEETPGWVEGIDPQGVKRLARCPCFKAYKDRAEANGMHTQLALPSAPVAQERDGVDA